MAVRWLNPIYGMGNHGVAALSAPTAVGDFPGDELRTGTHISIVAMHRDKHLCALIAECSSGRRTGPDQVPMPAGVGRWADAVVDIGGRGGFVKINRASVTGGIDITGARSLISIHNE
ncbi:hypothetical protein [Streptosporangium sp. NPDC049046]|uniref:hypothetical protein n=1 Tax=unclassified Streptosporangium TaxID=2632669 RepID=UPI003428330F